MSPSGMDSRSLPSNSMRPVTRELPGDSNRMIDIAVTLLPEPDSPTMATVSFGAISKLTSLTTLRHSPPTRKAVLRSEIESTGSIIA